MGGRRPTTPPPPAAKIHKKMHRDAAPPWTRPKEHIRTIRRAGNKRISPPPTHATGCQRRSSRPFQDSRSLLSPPHDTPRLYTFYVVANFQQIIQTFHQFVDVCWPAVDFKRRDVAARAFRTFRWHPSFAYLLDGSPRATRHFNWSIYIPAARPKCSSFGLCRRINGVANSIILLSLLQQKSP